MRANNGHRHVPSPPTGALRRSALRAASFGHPQRSRQSVLPFLSLFVARFFSGASSPISRRDRSRMHPAPQKRSQLATLRPRRSVYATVCHSCGRCCCCCCEKNSWHAQGRCAAESRVSCSPVRLRARSSGGVYLPASRVPARHVRSSRNIATLSFTPSGSTTGARFCEPCPGGPLWGGRCVCYVECCFTGHWA